jgi:CBS domain-containing protein
LVITGAGGRITGIVSERDIVRAMARHGAAALGLPLNDVMTRKVVTCEPNDSISNLMELMTDGKFRHLPVVQEERLAGIVSIGDVVKSRLAELEYEQTALRDYIQTA